MRILVANDGLGAAGGVQTYLDAVGPVLARRGHELALAFCNDERHDDGVSGSIQQLFPVSPATVTGIARRWAPDVCFSNNMTALAVDRELTGVAPLVKFMHGYMGTCIGGQKAHAFPAAAACSRAYGPACVALYGIRRCGSLHPRRFVDEWRWAEEQRALFARYAAIVVASRHMCGEYERSGVPAAALCVNPLFAPAGITAAAYAIPDVPHIAFLGRMTRLKGGDALVAAVARAQGRLGRAIRVTFMGDGPEKTAWHELALRMGVNAVFPGWVAGDRRWALLRDVSLVALPGVWPEPFGLVGLEAGALGIPAVAIASGGITEWLRDEVNGVAVPPRSSPETFGDALAAVLGDEARLARLRRGAESVAREMSVDAHVDRLEAIFDRVAGVRVRRAAAAH